MKILDKQKVDEVIRLNHKYYKTGDRDICTVLIATRSEVEPDDIHDKVGSAIDAMAHIKGVTYNQIYNALEDLGYEVKEISKDGE
jgi:hypothetical protein